MISNVVSAESYSEIEGLEYYVNFENTICISKYKGNETELVIPNEIEGKEISAIETSAFQECKDITSISIPDTVKYIRKYVFCDCSSLKEMTIPDSVILIEEDAFKNCSSLTSVTIPDNPVGTIRKESQGFLLILIVTGVR